MLCPGMTLPREVFRDPGTGSQRGADPVSPLVSGKLQPMPHFGDGHHMASARVNWVA